MPKLQILLDKGNVTFNNNYNKGKRVRILNFPSVAILDFMMPLHCPFQTKEPQTKEPQIETRQWCHEIQDGSTQEI